MNNTDSAFNPYIHHVETGSACFSSSVDCASMASIVLAVAAFSEQIEQALAARRRICHIRWAVHEGVLEVITKNAAKPLHWRVWHP